MPCLHTPYPSPTSLLRRRLVVHRTIVLVSRVASIITVCTVVVEHSAPEVLHHEGETLAQRDLGLPPEKGLGVADVRLALVGVILGVLAEGDGGRLVDHLADNLIEEHGRKQR